MVSSLAYCSESWKKKGRDIGKEAKANQTKRTPPAVIWQPLALANPILAKWLHEESSHGDRNEAMHWPNSTGFTHQG